MNNHSFNSYSSYTVMRFKTHKKSFNNVLNIMLCDHNNALFCQWYEWPTYSLDEWNMIKDLVHEDNF